MNSWAGIWTQVSWVLVQHFPHYATLAFDVMFILNHHHPTNLNPGYSYLLVMPEQ